MEGSDKFSPHCTAIELTCGSKHDVSEVDHHSQSSPWAFTLFLSLAVYGFIESQKDV
jgi:hypothetical protein